MPKHNVSDSELRDFLRKRITNISTAAEDDIIGIVHKEREAAEKRGRDAAILELITGYDGLLKDLQQIESATKSMGVKASALATRLSAVRLTNKEEK